MTTPDGSQHSILAWEEPPPARGAGRTSLWADVAKGLRARPGDWALIYRATTTAAGLATTIVNGRIEDFRPPGSFEAVSRRVPGSHPTVNEVYARFVGESAEVRRLRAETLRDAADRRARDFVCCDVHDRLSRKMADDWTVEDRREARRHAACYWAAATVEADRAAADRILRGIPVDREEG